MKEKNPHAWVCTFADVVITAVDDSTAKTASGPGLDPLLPPSMSLSH